MQVERKRDILIRELKECEYSVLSDFLYEAIFVPEGATPPDKSIITLPELQIYVQNFGKNEGDAALAADSDGRIVGVVWVRIMNDYGHVDDETPSLAISLYRVRNSIVPKVDTIALDFCIEMEKSEIVCVPIPANESQWDKHTGRYRSIVSSKHAAQAAGLGTIGRHSLLITPEFGSMIWLGTVLCDAELEPDKLKENICDNCNQCVEICPVNALQQPELDQQKCWNYAFGDDEEIQSWRIACHRCRDICPYNLGTKNNFLKKRI